MKLFFKVLATLLPTASVDTLVSILTEFAARLQDAEEKQRSIAIDYRKQIDALHDAREAALRSAEKAGRVAKNILNLTA